MADLRIYEVEAPDGKVIKVQAPSDATDAATAGISANNPAPTLFDCP